MITAQMGRLVRGPFHKQWRRERDSNPRNTLWAFTRFPVAPLQPLGHLSSELFREW